MHFSSITRWPIKGSILGLCLLVIVFGLLFERSVTGEHVHASSETSHSSSHSHSHSQDETRADRARQILDSTVFSEFESWRKQYLQGNFAEAGEHLRRGEQLALKRRELLKELIVLAPKAALERAITSDTSQQLPAS